MYAPATVVTPDGGRLTDFYAWAFADLRSNALRGIFAEWLVARAVGADPAVGRVEWDNYDVTAPSGTRIEVKTGAYVQAWSTQPSTRIAYSGLMAREWLSSGATYSEDARVRADVYVFALQTCREPDAYDALDLSQWEFRVVLGDTVRQWKQKTISLSRLISLGFHTATFEELGHQINSLNDK